MPKAGRRRTKWTTAGRQVFKVHLETDADTIGVGSSRNRSLNIAARILWVEELFGRKGSGIDYSRRVVLNNSCVAKCTGDRNSVALGTGEG